MKFLLLLAHEGHDHALEFGQFGQPETLIQWLGSIHLILLHFPIALINMLIISEILFAWSKRPIYEFSSRFLLISSAILTVPTSIFGFIYSYSAAYVGIFETYLFWHMWSGILATLFVIAAAFLSRGRPYYSCLFLMFLLVNITAFFGGGLTFGPYSVLEPV